MKVTEKDREAAQAITGPCSCDVAYTGRGLRSPDCSYCNDAEGVAEAIAAAYARGLEDAAKVAEDSAAYQPGGKSGQLVQVHPMARAIAAAIRKIGEGA